MIIISTNFNCNFTVYDEYYDEKVGSVEFGTKICEAMPSSMLLAPRTDGGYIAATPRPPPGASEVILREQLPISFSRSTMTNYVYSSISQDQCPAVNNTFSVRNPRESEMDQH